MTEEVSGSGSVGLRPLIEFDAERHGMRSVLVVSHERLRRVMVELYHLRSMADFSGDSVVMERVFAAWSRVTESMKDLEAAHALLVGGVEYDEGDLRDGGWLPELEVSTACGVKPATVRKWRRDFGPSGTMRVLELVGPSGEHGFWIQSGTVPVKYRGLFGEA